MNIMVEGRIVPLSDTIINSLLKARVIHRCSHQHALPEEYQGANVYHLEVGKTWTDYFSVRIGEA